MIKALGDKVLLEKSVVEENKTPGGLYLPDSQKNGESSFKGKVKSVGPDVKGIKEGDTVILGKYSGTEIKEDKDTYLVVKEEDILAVVTE